MPLPSGYAQVRYRAQYHAQGTMNRIVNVIVKGSTAGEAAAAAARLEQTLADSENPSHLPYLQLIDITHVEDLDAIITEESGGIVLSEVQL